MNNKDNVSIQLVQTSAPNKFKVKLILPDEVRWIGELNAFKEGTFFTKRRKEHLFKKLNALGISHQILISEELDYKWIVIDYDGKRLVTSREYFLAHGKLLHFKDKGFEPQVFLPLSEFGIDSKTV